MQLILGAENKLQPAENSPCLRWLPVTSAGTSNPTAEPQGLLFLPAAPGPQPVGKGREKAEVTPPTLSEHRDTDPSVLFNWNRELWGGRRGP